MSLIPILLRGALGVYAVGVCVYNHFMLIPKNCLKFNAYTHVAYNFMYKMIVYIYTYMF